MLIQFKSLACGRALFGATLRNAFPVAVGAPKGQRIHVTGLDNLKPNPR